MNLIREKTEYCFARTFLFLLRILPTVFIYAICQGLALLFFYLIAKRRKIALKNLEFAFPEKSDAERLEIAKKSYKHFGNMIAESAMILTGKIKPSDLELMIEGDGIDKILDLERDYEKGILCITGHLGNFELFSHHVGMHTKRQTYAVARMGDNKLIEEQIVKPMRESFGSKIIHKSHALRHVAKALQRGDHVGLLIDIKTNNRDGVLIDFFGQKTFALKSTAFLQTKIDSPVIPAAMVSVGKHKYKLIIGDQIFWNGSNKATEDEIAELTQIHHAALENLIRKYPEQWLWMHDRWKSSRKTS